ncbi:MAG: ATP-binding protein [Firmicutes bacterium]|jgi:PAS domain S-box-containing protein|nr:ATP-binding protein [Bacillota bacterium]
MFKKTRNFRSLNFKIPFDFMILHLIISLIGIPIIVGLVTSYSVTESFERNKVVSEMLSNEIFNYVSDAAETVKASAIVTSENYGNDELIFENLERVYDRYSYFDIIVYLDLQGNIKYSIPGSEKSKHVNYGDFHYFQNAIELGDTYITDIFKSRILDIDHFVIGHPVRDNEGNIAGLIVGGIPLENIEKKIQQTDKIFEGNIRIIDKNGNYLYNPYEYKELKPIENFTIYTDLGVKKIKQVYEQGLELTGIADVDGNKYRQSISNVKNVGWTIIVEESNIAILINSFNEILLPILFFTGFLIIIGMVAGRQLIQTVTLPIDRLGKNIRAGQYGDGWIDDDSLDTADELGELYRTLKYTNIALQENTLQLRKSFEEQYMIQKHMSSILMSVSTGIVVTNNHGEITMYNRAMENLTQYSSKFAIGMTIEKFSEIVEIDFKRLINSIDPKNLTSEEIRWDFVRRDKTSKRCSVITSSVTNSEDQHVGYVFVIKDLEDILKLQDEVSREDRINTIGEFASSIIHDIGNPLSGISNLLELWKNPSISQEHRNEITEMLEDEVDDLNELVANYLDFIRSDKRSDSLVDVDSLINNVLRILRSEINDRNILVDKSFDKCSVYMNRRSLKQAMMNILKNSIQAIDDGGTISINVSCDEMDVRISIKDTGKGIDKEHLDKIFQPFYSTKKKGVGLGLSITHRFIHEYGGTIDVNSVVGLGTEFIITIPMESEVRQLENTNN